MNDLIVEYLFAYNSCPLPGIGELKCYEKSAIHFIAEKKIVSPTYNIVLLESNVDEEQFVKYISTQLNIPFPKAYEYLQSFCNKIIESREEYTELGNAGKIYVNEGGIITFQQQVLPDSFNSEVDATRIERKDVHQVLVGDIESTSEEMADFYNTPSKKTKKLWWVWALIILITGIAIIVFYMNDLNHNNTFGNAKPVNPPPIQKTFESR